MPGQHVSQATQAKVSALDQNLTAERNAVEETALTAVANMTPKMIKAKDEAEKNRLMKQGQSMKADQLEKQLAIYPQNQEGLAWLKDLYRNASTTEVVEFRQYQMELWKTRQLADIQKKKDADYAKLLNKATMEACAGMTSSSTACNVMLDVRDNLMMLNNQSQNDFMAIE